MQSTDIKPSRDEALHHFSRTRYFYGQLLDVEHFSGEQMYSIGKRRLLNRQIVGYGVVCGLDVRLCDDGKSVVVTPGLALDPCGREIVVPCPSRPVPLPSSQLEFEPDGKPEDEEDCDESDNYVQVCLCYSECETDPTPVLAADCGAPDRCVSGKIEERYRIEIKPGKAPRIDLDCSVGDLVSGGRINYQALAIWVTQAGCAKTDCCACLPLANVKLPEPGGECDCDDVDITIRPIVYTNDLLWELFMGLIGEPHPHGRGGKY